jgi:nucleotide-binding universal stress UspA family protein
VCQTRVGAREGRFLRDTSAPTSDVKSPAISDRESFHPGERRRTSHRLFFIIAWGMERNENAATRTIRRGAPMYRRILLPVDLAEPDLTERVTKEGEMLAQAGTGSELRLLNVRSHFFDYAPVDFDENQIRAGIEQELADVASKIDYPRERISTAVLFGRVYLKVLAEAEEWNADLIVLCSHRLAADRFLIGSNAQAIVLHAICSVLVVRR